ncbi:hypothetical protein Q1695_008973 [Nippostrongylus brasiliensis]|nr:hypothetical protein Q1695_008973 [Nippostrongylus brasiliensis]
MRLVRNAHFFTTALVSLEASATFRLEEKVAASRMFTTSACFAAPVRIPLIKFVGARLPRPNFARVVSGPIPSTPAPQGAPASGSNSQSRSFITEDQLPTRFRRPPIDQEEIDAINSGGAYGL